MTDSNSLNEWENVIIFISSICISFWTVDLKIIILILLNESWCSDNLRNMFWNDEKNQEIKKSARINYLNLFDGLLHVSDIYCIY